MSDLATELSKIFADALAKAGVKLVCDCSCHRQTMNIVHNITVPSVLTDATNKAAAAKLSQTLCGTAKGPFAGFRFKDYNREIQSPKSGTPQNTLEVLAALASQLLPQASKRDAAVLKKVLVQLKSKPRG